MTITHPWHPLRGQQVPLLRVRSGRNAALIVRFPDGFPCAIPADWTDYSGSPSGDRPPPTPLLEGEALRQIVHWLAHRPPPEAAPPAPGAPDQEPLRGPANRSASSIT